MCYIIIFKVSFISKCPAWWKQQLHSSFISICTDCILCQIFWGEVFTCRIIFSGVRLRDLFHLVCHFVCIFCTQDTFPSETEDIYDHRQSRTRLHVPCCQEALILKSWSQSSRQFSLFSSSEADRRSDRWWTSQCIWSPRTQSAGRTMLPIKLFSDWLVVSSKEKILCFSAPAILFPEFEEQSLNWLKLAFLKIKVFEKYFSIHNKQSRLHVVLLKLVQLLHGAVLETPGAIICINKDTDVNIYRYQ